MTGRYSGRMNAMRSMKRILHRTVFTAAALAVIGAAAPAGPVCLAADIQSDPILFYHESSDMPGIQNLIDEFRFDRFLLDGGDEYTRMTLLKDWVYSRIPYDLNFNDSELRNAQLILRRARNREPFLCTNLSAVYLQCAVSLGWTARYIFLRKPTGEEHAANDIWSNQFRKWIYIDTSWNIHVEKHGVPLSLGEIRIEWKKNKGRDLVFVYGAGATMKKYTIAQLPVTRQDSKIWSYLPLDRGWLDYTYEVAVVGRNDFFSCAERNCMGDIWDPMYIILDRLNRRDKGWAFRDRKRVSSLRQLFHDINRVDIAVENKGAKRWFTARRSVEISLNAFGKNNFTPNFQEFLVKVNGEQWKTAGERFVCTLPPGNNYLRARVVNRFGVLGPVYKKKIFIRGGERRRRHAVPVARTAEGFSGHPARTAVNN